MTIIITTPATLALTNKKHSNTNILIITTKTSVRTTDTQNLLSIPKIITVLPAIQMIQTRTTTTRRIKSQQLKKLTSEYVGDKHSSFKNNNILNIMFGNIHSLPTYNSDPKNDKFREFIQKHEFDIVGLSEVNTYWNKFSHNQRSHNQFSSWFK